jgi:hypothetical protein
MPVSTLCSKQQRGNRRRRRRRRKKQSSKEVRINEEIQKSDGENLDLDLECFKT